MRKKVRGVSAGQTNRADESHSLDSPKRVTAIVVALENYRRGELPVVDYAHADADAFAAALSQIYPADILEVEVIKDEEATLTALRYLGNSLKNLGKDDLFIFYYAGHGFHGAGENRLSVYDTNRFNIAETALSLQGDLLEHIGNSECRQALIFVDACAEKFAAVAKSRDVISNLEREEVERFLDNNWYCGVYLSCSPREKSYPDDTLGHGIWTHFLLEAMQGRDEEALRDRWLTDTSLRDYLRKKVPDFISRETMIKGHQTPQAILSSSGSFRIRHVEEKPAVATPANEALANIILDNQGEFLEGVETGRIRSLAEFRSIHREPSGYSDSADKFCRGLLDAQIRDELQQLYQATISAFGARRRDVQKGEDHGAGDLAYQFYRYSIYSAQNPEDHTEYVIYRTLELREGWEAHREAIEEVFDCEFDYLVITFSRLKLSFDQLVESLEDVRDAHGGEIDDDDSTKRVKYSREDADFTFDLHKRRLEIEIAGADALDILDGVRHFQLGNTRPSSMLAGSAS